MAATTEELLERLIESQNKTNKLINAQLEEQREGKSSDKDTPFRKRRSSFSDEDLGLVGKLTDLIDALGSEAYDLFKTIDEGTSTFAKATGMIKEAGPLYSAFSSQVRGLGLSFGESANELAGLIDTIPDFLLMSKQQSLEIGKLSAQLTRLGGDAKTFGTTFTNLTRVFGMTRQEALKTNIQLVEFGKSIGIAPRIIMKDFGAALPKLAQFGKEAPQIFKDSAFYAKKLGIDLQAVLGQIDKFDSFESAAEAAGNLNIILRENLFDTQELLFADPAERVKIFVEKFERLKNVTGKTFDDFDRFKKSQLAKVSGFDVETLSKLSKITTGELAKQKDLIKVAADGSVSFQKSVSTTLSFSERLGIIKDKLASAFLPLLEYVGPMVDTLGKYIGYFVNGVKSLYQEFPGLTKVMTGLTSAFIAYKAAAGVGIVGPNSVFSAIGNAITGLIPGMGMLSKYSLPILGTAFAAAAAKGDQFVDDIKGMQVLGTGKSVQQLLKLTDKDVKAIKDNIESVKTFVRDGFDSMLKSVGIGESDRTSIIESIKKVFVEIYDEMAKGLGVVGKIFQSGMLGFGSKMKELEGVKGNPFAKLILGLTAGLEQALIELKLSMAGSGAPTSDIGKAFTGLISTVTDFSNYVGKEISKALGGILGKPGTPGILEGLYKNLETFVQSPVFQKIGAGAIDILTMAVGGISDLFKFLTGAITNPANLTLLANGLTQVMTAIGNGINSLFNSSSAGGGLLGTAAASLQTIGQATFGLVAAGIGGLANAISKVNPTSINTVTSSLSSATPMLNNLSTLKPVPQNVITSFDALGNSINALAVAMNSLSGVTDGLKAVTELDTTKIANVTELSNAVKEYSDALEKISRYSAEQDKMKQVMQEFGATLAGLTLTVDANKMGDIIGEKTAKAVKIALHR